MKVIRLTKDDQSKYVSEHVFDAKGAEHWKEQGYKIDYRPYTRTIDSTKGAVYTLNAEAWKEEKAMHERAEEGNDNEEPAQEATKPKRGRKPKAE